MKKFKFKDKGLIDQVNTKFSSKPLTYKELSEWVKKMIKDQHNQK